MIVWRGWERNVERGGREGIGVGVVGNGGGFGRWGGRCVWERGEEGGVGGRDGRGEGLVQVPKRGGGREMRGLMEGSGGG